MLSHLLLNQADSDIDTNNSSFQQFESSKYEKIIGHGICILQKYQAKLIQTGFSKILCRLALFRPQKAQQIIKRAEIYFNEKQYNSSFQLTNLIMCFTENNNNILYEKSLIILLQISIINRNMQLSKVFLQKLSTLNQKIHQDKFLLLKLKFYLLQEKYAQIMSSLNQLEIYIQTRCISQQAQLVIIYCEYCMQIGMDWKAFDKLQQFLPQLIRCNRDQNNNITKIYLLLAEIQKRKQNYQKQWCHLVCASATIQRMYLQSDLFVLTQYRKLKNLIQTNHHQKAFQLLQNLLYDVPEKILHKSNLILDLQSIYKSLKQNCNIKISERQNKLCQLTDKCKIRSLYGEQHKNLIINIHNIL